MPEVEQGRTQGRLLVDCFPLVQGEGLVISLTVAEAPPRSATAPPPPTSSCPLQPITNMRVIGAILIQPFKIPVERRKGDQRASQLKGQPKGRHPQRVSMTARALVDAWEAFLSASSIPNSFTKFCFYRRVSLPSSLYADTRSYQAIWTPTSFNSDGEVNEASEAS